MKKRDLNFEILRILGMLFIIGMHYLDKGGLMISDFDKGLTAFDLLVRIIEAFLVCGVNIYVLIGAYYLCQKDFSLKRVLKIWGLTLFYSIVIGIVHLIVCACLGIGFPLDKYGVFNLAFPIIGEHYWFVSVYIILVIIGPLLNCSLKKLSRKSFCQLLITLTIVLSVSVTFIPMKLPVDGQGMNLSWFILLYMYGAYIRWHGIKIMDSAVKSIIVYIASSMCIFAGFFVTEGLYEKTHTFGDYITRQYHYNSLFCLLASLGLFYYFKNMNIELPKIEGGLLKLAGLSFGVYLIHEHILIRYQWPKALGISEMYGDPKGIILFIPIVILIYLLCGLVESIRQKLFKISDDNE